MATDPHADVAERFKRDTAGHEMTVLRDDGLYRHLRFRKSAKGYSEYWFDLVTWPGKLVVTGDMETFAFSRTEDMFEVFRRQRANPGYWAEKLLAPKSRDESVRKYSEDLFRQLVTEHAAEAEEEWPGLGAAVTAAYSGYFPDWDTSGEEGARAGARDFEFGAKWAAKCSCGRTAEFADELDAHPWSRSHGEPFCTPATTKVDGFKFTGTWEWDLADWSYQYLWCCHAIVLGIGLYDAAQLAAKEKAGA